MPFTAHTESSPDPKGYTQLWRYVDLPKFMAMIQMSALNFRNLVALPDRFEGTPAIGSFDFRNWQTPDDAPEDKRMHSIADYYAGQDGGRDSQMGFLRYKAQRERRIRRWYAHRRAFFVNCWHLNDCESSAMWSIYAARGDGIALVSNITLLAAALSGASVEVVGGRIRYGDYHDEGFLFGYDDAYAPALHKRKSFESESEYRLIYRDRSILHKGQGPEERDVSEIERREPQPNYCVPVDLNALIKRVIVSPLADSWFADVVTEAAARYGLRARVEPSSLSSPSLR